MGDGHRSTSSLNFHPSNMKTLKNLPTFPVQKPALQPPNFHKVRKIKTLDIDKLQPKETQKRGEIRKDAEHPKILKNIQHQGHIQHKEFRGI